MNKVKFYFILSIASLGLISCSKSNNDIAIEPLRDYTVQNTVDNSAIVEYLNNYHFEVTNNPGGADDQDVTITKIPTGGTDRTIMSYLDAPSYPTLKTRPVNKNGVVYTLYYLVLRPGTGESPCNVDGVLASYKGDYLFRTAATTTAPIVPSVLLTSTFEESKFPQSYFSLYTAITGWSEIFPQFKTGDKPIQKADGTVIYNNFGAGILFIPSGLAYYNGASGAIPAYSPLIFSFKLYSILRLDQDGDGIPSYLEDHNKDGYVYDYRNKIAYPVTPTDNVEDTDKDGIPDFLDIDDDGDGYNTKLEITKPAGSAGLSKYYPYNPFIVADDPLTPNVDESLQSEPKGIPSFVSPGVYDYLTPGRLRIHLDSAHH